jgi:hypothetical protein
MKVVDDLNFEKDDDGNVTVTPVNFQPMKELLDSTGPGFCLAKWNQVTTHLGAGITHSCHHVGAHKIPLEELKDNPGALHNTIEKKERRKEMLRGERPKECDYCWRIEDNIDDYSDRVHKSIQQWAIVDHDVIAKSTGDEDVYPRYVEVSFSNVCNFKCTYCGPPFSSKWAEEIKTNGPYKLKQTHYNGIKETQIPYLEREENPYIIAFWKWFPDAVEHMTNFRITGGEPLLSKHTFTVLDYLLEHPQPKLELSINTNACPPNTLWTNFVLKLKQLEEQNVVKTIIIHTSAESTGAQAEYSRDGMDWELFSANVKFLLDNTTTTLLSFMSAFNILSLPTLTNYIRHVKLLKRKYGKRVTVDFAYVRHPQFLDIKIATDELVLRYFKTAVDYMKDSPEFTEWETIRFERIYKDCESRFTKEDSDVILNRYRFWQFVQEYDCRRNRNFVEIFPEYTEFLKLCKGA